MIILREKRLRAKNYVKVQKIDNFFQNQKVNICW